MDLLNGEHQLCHVHYIKNLNKKFEYILNSCKSEDERNKAEKHIKGIYNLFKAESYEKAKEILGFIKLEKDKMCRKLRDIVDRYIIHDFKRLTAHLRDGNIQKTANKIENYFRQTFPRSEKKKLYSKQSKEVLFNIKKSPME
jgi:hypothetical protein